MKMPPTTLTVIDQLLACAKPLRAASQELIGARIDAERLGQAQLEEGNEGLSQEAAALSRRINAMVEELSAVSDRIEAVVMDAGALGQKLIAASDEAER